jgi:hypothetical protein
MLKFIANFFGKKPAAPVAPAPYKVETPKEVSVPKATTAKSKTVKTPAVKAKTARKPKAPKA